MLAPIIVCFDEAKTTSKKSAMNPISTNRAFMQRTEVTHRFFFFAEAQIAE